MVGDSLSRVCSVIVTIRYPIDSGTTIMSESNPFQSSSTPASQLEAPSEIDTVLHEAGHSLAETKPWVRFLSVLGFIGTGVAATFLLVGLLAGGVAPSPFELIILVPMGLLFYLIPSVLLWKYGTRIGEFLGGSSPESFSAALIAQKTFWKYLGILALIIIVVYGLMLASFIVLPLLLGSMR